VRVTLIFAYTSIIMTEKKGFAPLLSVPDKADKRAAALRENLKKRKQSATDKHNSEGSHDANIDQNNT